MHACKAQKCCGNSDTKLNNILLTVWIEDAIADNVISLHRHMDIEKFVLVKCVIGEMDQMPLIIAVAFIKRLKGRIN